MEPNPATGFSVLKTGGGVQRRFTAQLGYTANPGEPCREAALFNNDVQAIPTTFFIDRRGVIQSVLVGYHDLATLKSRATQPDVEGAPKAAPGASQK